ncbi:GNAT family N-acetyltransferase [Bacteroides sp. AF25-5LB]|jgi:ribosomal protein S18 acetylase RimI-like enzyme|nr:MULTISPECIES: GNAT family N-acetyltransferase [unclassified Bacteroides]RJV31630.1 GNAT family N-acetyltransferase [Bacteroides sp. AF25-17LB]RJV31678.1 GNAT family N-acetyltransferase [Bacteroides sp. AF25-5LB]
MNKTINYKIRPLCQDESSLLKDFLYEAIFIPEGMEAPSRDVVNLPELKLYVEHFGTKEDDFCLVADCEGKVVGAVWVRIMNDYGHIDDQTPSLSIALYKEYRNKGIGSHLMNEMTELLRKKGYKRVSLSVQKANRAVHLYLKLRFKVAKETMDEFIMTKELSQLNPQYKLLPLEDKDIPEMQELFRSTVLNVNIRHYTKEEVEDWASCGDSVEHLKELLSHNHFIGAFDEASRMVGFSSMNKDGYLHSMFVHKDWQGKGVATQLLSEVEHIARQWGVAEITSEVSLTARPFFEKKGYEIVKMQKHRANKLELTNFIMRKLL